MGPFYKGILIVNCEILIILMRTLIEDHIGLKMGISSQDVKDLISKHFWVPSKWMNIILRA